MSLQEGDVTSRQLVIQIRREPQFVFFAAHVSRLLAAVIPRCDVSPSTTDSGSVPLRPPRTDSDMRRAAKFQFFILEGLISEK
jgi:hypothetical protein